MSSVAPTGTAGTAATSTGGSVISSTGIGSGLDITSIVSTLTTAAGAAENTQLANRKSTINAQVSAYGTFSAALETFQAALATLQSPTTLAARTATLGNDKVATASATSSAIRSTYSLSVQNLATAASLSSAPLGGSSASVGTGTLTITVGGTTTSIDIDSTNETLAGIAAAINKDPNNPGVTATILTTTAGSRLILAGTATGAGNAITVTQAGGDGGLAALTYDPSSTTNGLSQTQAATNANFTVNGFAATSGSNQVTSVIDGVTLNLLTPTTTGTGNAAVDTPTTLTVGDDTDSAKTSIGTFVTALNGLVNSIQTLTSYDASTQTAGPLLGNATLQSFQSQLQKILGQVTAASSSGGPTSLAALGIAATPSGGFTTDDTKLGNALTGNLSGVAALLGGTNGIATQLNDLVNHYSGTGGLLNSINQGLQTGLKNIANQQSALNSRLSIYSATLTREYNAMDTAVALLKQTQTYLTAQFNPSSSSGSSVNSSLGSGNVSTG